MMPFMLCFRILFIRAHVAQVVGGAVLICVTCGFGSRKSQESLPSIRAGKRCGSGLVLEV